MKFFSRERNLERARVINAIGTTYDKFLRESLKRGYNQEQADRIAIEQVKCAFNKAINENDFCGFTKENGGRAGIQTLTQKELRMQIEDLAKESLIGYEKTYGQKKQTLLSEFYYNNRNYFPSCKEFYDAAVTEGVSNSINIMKVNRIKSENSKPRKKVDNLRGRTPKDLYVLSDFHGELEGLNKAIDKVNEGKKVIVLGDAMDRGQYGMEILEHIMNMKQSGKSIEYVPGNHDLFLVETLDEAMRAYEKTGNIHNFQMLAENHAQMTFYKQSRNGGEPTYKRVIEMARREPGKLYQIGRWLESQPLLRIEADSREKIALGHAAFDTELYKMNYTLNDYIHEKDPRLHDKAEACLWYRTSPEYSRMRGKVDLPSYVQADNIIVGHTPNARNVLIEGRNGTRNAICVDGGIVSRVKDQTRANSSKVMLKYETKAQNQRRNGPDVTMMYGR